MTTSTWAQFIDTHARGDRNADIARRLGIDSSNITRWRKDGKTPEPAAAVAFAREYNAHPIAALVAAGYLTDVDLERTLMTPADLSEITTTQLLDELQRRLTDLSEIFDALEQSGDKTAFESILEALNSRHLPESVSGSTHNATITRLETSEYIDADTAQQILTEHRYAADERDGRDDEQNADPHP